MTSSYRSKKPVEFNYSDEGLRAHTTRFQDPALHLARWLLWVFVSSSVKQYSRTSLMRSRAWWSDPGHVLPAHIFSWSWSKLDTVLIQPTVPKPLLEPKGSCSAYRLTLELFLTKLGRWFSGFMKQFVSILFPLKVLLGLVPQKDEILESRGWLSLAFPLLHWCRASTCQVLHISRNMRKRHVHHSECFMLQFTHHRKEIWLEISTYLSPCKS